MIANNSPARRYCYTHHVESREDWAPVLGDHVIYHIAQLERCPTTGALHWQGYVELDRPMRFTQLKTILDMPTAHVQASRGTAEQNIAYCSKQESRADNEVLPTILGTPSSGQGTRTDIAHAVALIRGGRGMAAVLDEAPETFVKYHRGLTAAAELTMRLNAQERRSDLKVVVLTGPPGCGKTRWVHDNVEPDSLYSLTQSAGTVWWNGYTGQSHLLLDDYYGWIQWGELLRILDIYPLQVQTKGGFVSVSYRTVYITSNRPWDHWYSKSRPFSEQGALQRRIHEVWTFSPDGSHQVSAPQETPVTAHAAGFVAPGSD